MWREWVRERVADPNETEIRRRIMWMLAVNVALGLALVWFNLMVQDLGYRVANTGERLFWVSGTAHGVSSDGVVVPEMLFPIPSDVATLDANYDGVVDRILVGDTGGQLWRIDLRADLS